MANEKKLRSIFRPDALKVREAVKREDGTTEESRIIEGCAIVFDRETTLWDDSWGRDREIISRSCISNEFLATQDVKLNLLHKRDSSVARNNKGVGTLKFNLREDGLYFEAEMPKCDLGDQALELVRNQTYTGCSFEFHPKDYEISRTKLPDGREDCLVTHKTFASLNALTIAMDPAYQETSVSARESIEELTRSEQALLERQQAEKEAEHLRTRLRESDNRFLALKAQAALLD